MHIAVLANADSWYLRDLERAAAGRHQISGLDFSQLHATLGGAPQIRCGEFDVSAADAVLVRTMPPGSLEQVVFRMDLLSRLTAAGTPVVNPPRAIEAAVDKYLTSALLESAGLIVPETRVCQDPEQAMQAFGELGGDVVVKPLFGSEGRGIARLQDEALAERAFKMLAQLRAVLYVQRFVQHEGADLRLLVIGQRVLAMRRRNALDWRTNISRGATAEAFDPSDELVETARRAAAAVGAPVAGVDLLQGRDGRMYAIEVNAVPGWKALARVTGIDVAGLVLDYVASCVERRGVPPGSGQGASVCR
ncbi:MAG TPA: RimK family alpha-L-glutamate ligase [Pirellulales bacterium]|jgi:ribosomal protein S6--L-glutamate ligase|nr:RimK family alpha-L-glutamate ligase [Pirellulales bacterium]